MSEVKGLPRPPFFPNSRTAVKSRETRKMKELLNSRRNTLERANELNQKTAGHTKVNIPDKVKDFSRIKAAVDSAPQIDNSAKIARLKKQVQSGEYKVDYDALADKILTSEY